MGRPATSSVPVGAEAGEEVWHGLRWLGSRFSLTADAPEDFATVVADARIRLEGSALSASERVGELVAEAVDLGAPEGAVLAFIERARERLSGPEAAEASRTERAARARRRARLERPWNHEEER